MKFNPFEAFSVRSRLGKSVMAVLGIVVMLTFVLSTGAMGSKNDFFDQVVGWFGGKGSKEVVAKVYGVEVTDYDLAETTRERRAARQFINEAVQISYSKWAKDLEDDLKSSRLSAETKRDIERFVMLKVNEDKDPRAYGAYLMDFQRFGPEAQKLGQAMSRARLKPDSEDKKALDAVAAIILHDMGLTPTVLVELGDSDRDTLDFITLQKKADQLGINYSKEGIADLVNQETSGRLTQERSNSIERRMRESGRFGEFSPDWLTEAIGKEYRARAALAALQGRSPKDIDLRARRANSLPALILGIDTTTLPLPGSLNTLSGLPGSLTPHEFYDYYKDHCSEHTFDVLEIPAEAFLDKVTAVPTKEERIALFNKHRGDLPDPGKERPGFKDPRKVKVEFVSLDATAPRVTQALPKVLAASAFLCASAGALSGEPASALLFAAQPALAESLPIREALSQKLAENHSRYGVLEQYEFTPRDVSIFRPQPLVALLGGMSGYPSLTTRVAALSLMTRHIEQDDLKTRVPFLLQAWLTPFSPTLGNAVGMPAFAYVLNPKLPAEGIYLPDVVKDFKKKQRQGLFEADVGQLRTKLFELQKDASPFGAKADKAKIDKAREESRKYIAGWVKDRNLTPVVTKAAMDEYAVAGDPDLKPLNALAISEPSGTNSLSKKLFETLDPRFGGSGGVGIARMQPFDPEWFPADPVGDGFDKPNYMMWVTDEIEPKSYNSLENANKLTNDEMTKRVDRAWKLEKARVLAKAEADKLADQIRAIAKNIGTDPIGVQRQLKDLAAQHKFRFFEIDGLAKLKFDHAATQARQEYKTPTIEKNQVLYPTPDFADQLLNLRKEPLGGVAVLQDVPRSRYYVACEVDRLEKSLEQFRDVFQKSAVTGVANNPLYNQYALPERRGEAVENVLARLRAEAKVEETEAFKNRSKKEVVE